MRLTASPVRFGSVPLGREIVEARWQRLLTKFNAGDQGYLKAHHLLNNRRIFITVPAAEQAAWREKIAEACKGDAEFKKTADGKLYYGGVEVHFEAPIPHWPLQQG